MKFTVLWRPAAEARLADLWTRVPNQSAFTDAANTIDRLLRDDPLGQGESRDGTERILFQPPLAVLYDVSEQDRMVYVIAVGLTPRLS